MSSTLILLSAGGSMATSRVSTSLSTVVLVLHLIFTILAIATLSYKVYYLESELSLIRQELSIGEQSNALSAIPTTPLSPTPSGETHSRGGRNRRVNQESKSPSAVQLQAECAQTILNKLRVC